MAGAHGGADLRPAPRAPEQNLRPAPRAPVRPGPHPVPGSPRLPYTLLSSADARSGVLKVTSAPQDLEYHRLLVQQVAAVRPPGPPSRSPRRRAVCRVQRCRKPCNRARMSSIIHYPTWTCHSSDSSILHLSRLFLLRTLNHSSPCKNISSPTVPWQIQPCLLHEIHTASLYPRLAELKQQIF